MIRVVVFFTGLGLLVGCGGGKPASGERTSASAEAFSTLACEVGYYSPGSQVLRIPSQSHLKQTAPLVRGEAMVQTPQYETGGSRLAYAASRTADGRISLTVECGNSGQSQSFSSAGTVLVGTVECSRAPLPEFVYFANTEERAKTSAQAWEGALGVQSIAVSCGLK